MSEKFDISKLQKFASDLTRRYVVQVGIMGAKDNRKKGDTDNAFIGRVHEFGAPGIPRRSFLRMPLAVKSKEIIAETSGDNLLEALWKGQIELVLKRLGVACVKAVTEAFDTRGFGNWPPDKPATIRRKKNKNAAEDSPLIDTGQLRRAITFRVAKK